jgi:hypothetical protein
MPSTSDKQHRTMEAAAHDPAFAKKEGIPQSVARDFVAADKRASAGPHKEPDADQRGGRSDSDADDTRTPPRHHGSHDVATRTPPRQHDTHDAPMKPGHVPGPRQGQRRY